MFQIQVGLFSKHHEEIESKQIAVSPTVLMSGNAAEQSLLWLQYWHMQHPLDNISNGSYIVVEYTKKPFANAKPEECTLLSWLTYTIDHSTINSDIVVMTWNAPPFKEKYVAQHQHGMGMLRRKSQGSELDERGSEAIPTSSTIELEIVINKRNVHEEELF